MSTRAYITLKKGFEYRTIWVHWDGMNHGDTLVNMTPAEIDELWDIIDRDAPHGYLEHLFTNEKYEADRAEAIKRDGTISPYSYLAKPAIGLEYDDSDACLSCVGAFTKRPKKMGELMGQKTHIWDYAIAYIYDVNKKRMYVSHHGHNFRKVPDIMMKKPSDFYIPDYDKEYE